ADAAVALAAGKKVPGAENWSGGEKKVVIPSKFLKPVPITRANLDVVVKAGWITKDALCKGVPADKAPSPCKLANPPAPPSRGERAGPLAPPWTLCSSARSTCASA